MIFTDDMVLEPLKSQHYIQVSFPIAAEILQQAIVAFIDGHGINALPRSETHKWYYEA